MGIAKTVGIFVVLALLLVAIFVCFLYLRDKRRREKLVRRISRTFSGGNNRHHEQYPQQSHPINPGGNFTGQVTTYAVVPKDPSTHHTSPHAPVNYQSGYPPTASQAQYPPVYQAPYPSASQAPYPPASQAPYPAAYPINTPPVLHPANNVPPPPYHVVMNTEKPF